MGVTGGGYGGGVYVDGSFTMKDRSAVRGNSVINDKAGTAQGGGVYIAEGAFLTIESGEITNNTAQSTMLGSAHGGGIATHLGVDISMQKGTVTPKGAFKLINGTISNNKAEARASASGGGVYGNFTMQAGNIMNNKVIAIETGSNSHVYAYGGGVHGALIMNGGMISGNTVTAGRTWDGNPVTAYGGGVYGQFTMNAGEISRNSVIATNNINEKNTIAQGGGVFAVVEFIKTGGIIYGNHEPRENRNIAVGGKGHAVFFNQTNSLWRNATANEGQNSDRVDFWLNEIDLTYTVTHDNWPPTSLTFTFSENPGTVRTADIILSDNVESYSIEAGNGNLRTLTCPRITGTGIITASIPSVYKVYTGTQKVLLIPPAPTGLTAKPSASTITLSWNPVALTTAYKIYRSASEIGDYKLIATTSPSKFVDIRLSKSTQYFYRVTAINEAGESPFISVSGTTKTNNTKEAIDVNEDTIVIEWPRIDSETDLGIRNVISTVVNTAYSAGTTAITGHSLPGMMPTYTLTYVVSCDGYDLKPTIDVPLDVSSTLGISDSNSSVDRFYVHTGLDSNKTYNYKVSISKVTKVLQEIPVRRDESTVMTGSAKTWSNPFKGTWRGTDPTGEPLRLTLTNSTFSIEWTNKPDQGMFTTSVGRFSREGTYTYSGDTGFIYIETGMGVRTNKLVGTAKLNHNQLTIDMREIGLEEFTVTR
jgi:fibronectin type 3 domain-containing protein